MKKGIIEKEKKVVAKMIAIYCRGSHDSDLCDNCHDITAYVHDKLDKCPYGDDKPSCRKCPTHCYAPRRREQIRRIMRYSGPRMFIFGFLDWVRHKLK